MIDPKLGAIGMSCEPGGRRRKRQRNMRLLVLDFEQIEREVRDEERQRAFGAKFDQLGQEGRKTPCRR